LIRFAENNINIPVHKHVYKAVKLYRYISCYCFSRNFEISRWTNYFIGCFSSFCKLSTYFIIYLNTFYL